MKRFLTAILAGALAVSMAACGGSPAPSSSAAEPAAPESQASEPAAPAEPEPTPEETPDASAEGAEIAMITDLGTIDDKSFNQGTWEGVQQYAEANGKTCKYYKPASGDEDAYLSAIDLAVKGGAKVVVTPGFLFEVPIFKAQTAYPDVTFILIDGNPNDGAQPAATYKTEKNAVGVVYAEEQPGFLAGYAAVKEGYTKLGFLGGMAVPAVVRYGYGYLQGAEYAAKELGLADGSVTVNYHYTGGFEATPEAQTLAASWYQQGVEVIFGCGGSVGNSAMAAAATAGGKTIGVDVDQSGESDTVITSAMKNLSGAVDKLLGQFYDGTFPGGEALIYSAADGLVGLPMESSKFEKLTQADYDAICEKLKTDADGVASSIIKDVDASGNPVEPSGLPLTKVVVTVV